MFYHISVILVFFTLVAKLIKILHRLKLIFYLQSEYFVADNLYLYLVFVDIVGLYFKLNYFIHEKERYTTFECYCISNIL